MRGNSDNQLSMLAIVSLEDLVPQKHPIRKIKAMGDQELKRLSPVFDKMKKHGVRSCILTFTKPIRKRGLPSPCL